MGENLFEFTESATAGAIRWQKRALAAEAKLREFEEAEEITARGEAERKPIREAFDTAMTEANRLLLESANARAEKAEVEVERLKAQRTDEIDEAVRLLAKREEQDVRRHEEVMALLKGPTP